MPHYYHYHSVYQVEVMCHITNVGNARKKTYFYGRSFISFGGQYQPSTKLAILQKGLLSIQCIKDTSWIEELDLCSWDKLASFPLLAHLSRWLRSRDRVVPSGVEPLGNCKGQHRPLEQLATKSAS